MASFEIDTGASLVNHMRIEPVEDVLGIVLDRLPADPTQAQIDGALVCEITGILRTPKKLETVRRKLLSLWPLIAPLAERDPAGFDSILLEFAERSTELP